MFLFIFATKETQMKKITLFITTLLLTTVAFSQKKEKIKGTKVVTTQKYEVDAFTEIEIEDNLEVFLIKGDKNSIEIETDENLQAVINHQPYGNMLRLNTTKEIANFKKLEIRVTYTDSLKTVINRHEAKLNIISEMNIPKVTIKTFDYSKTFINVNSPKFSLIATDKSKVELNLKGNDSFIEMSKNSEIKALVASSKLKFDMYQKAEAIVEGDVTEMKVRLDNNAKYEGKKLTTKTLDLTTEGSTECSVNTNGNLIITANGKSDVKIYGEPKIEVKKFSGDATLYKKSK
jgi:Putative auto-transporter adhesin, head GIN domain